MKKTIDSPIPGTGGHEPGRGTRRRARAKRPEIPGQRGFTLVEAIVTMVVAGIVAAMVAVFMRAPVEAYVDTARRAMLVDAADTAARRIVRDVSGALPNSVRVDATGFFLEFVPIAAAGRYRALEDPSASSDPLLFDGVDTSFDIFGPAIALPAGFVGPSLVVYNLGLPGADVYENASPVRRNVLGLGSKVTFSGSGFSTSSPGHRFQIVGPPVSYACDLAGGMLWRYAGYDFQPSQPSSLSSLDGLGASRSLLASHLSHCKFTYGGALQSNALVSILLSFSRNGETVTLQQQAGVDNVP